MSGSGSAERSLLLTLPLELREQIIDDVLTAPPPPTVIIGQRRFCPKITVPALAISCRQLYQEVLPHFFARQKLDMYLCMDFQLSVCKKQLDHWGSMNIAFGQACFIGKDEWNDGHWRVHVRCPRSLEGGHIVHATSPRGRTKGPLSGAVLRGMEAQVSALMASRDVEAKLLDVRAVREIARMLLDGATRRTPREQRWTVHWTAGRDGEDPSMTFED